MPGLADGGVGTCKHNHIPRFAGVHRDYPAEIAVLRRRAGHIHFKVAEDIIHKARAIEARLRRTVSVIIVFPQLGFAEINQAVLVDDDVFGLLTGIPACEGGTEAYRKEDHYFNKRTHLLKLRIICQRAYHPGLLWHEIIIKYFKILT